MSSFALKLNRRVTLQRHAAGKDALGQPNTNWQDVLTVWAHIRNENGVQTLKAGAETSKLKASIRIRYRTGLTEDMRVLYGAVAYQIAAILPDEEGKQFIDLVCEAIK